MEILRIFWREIIGIVMGLLMIGYVLLSFCAIPEGIAEEKNYPPEI